MNLLYVVQYWPSLFETYMFREVAWMRGRGHRVAVVSLGSGGPAGFRQESGGYVDPADFGVDDVPVLQIDWQATSREEIVRNALAFARRHEVDLIDAHFAREPAEVACDLHRTSGLPFTVRMRGGDVHSRVSPRLAEIVARAKAISPVSRFLADVLIGARSIPLPPPGIPVPAAAEKLRVLPYNLASRHLAREPVAQNEGAMVVGTAGRLVPLKRFEDVIDAVASLAGKLPDLQLLIIGGGALMPELRARAERLGVADRVHLTGFKSWEEVMTLLDGVHVYVQASALEGFCLTAVEAGFKGIPLVLSRTGIHEECVVPGRNGFLFDPGDVDTLARRLRTLARAGARERTRMGAASLEVVGGRFSEENVMPEIESVFQAAVAYERSTP